MAQPTGPVPPVTQRPSHRRLWITLGVLGALIYVGLQALSEAALFYLSNPSLTQNKAPAAPSGWHIATPSGQATSYSYAVSIDTPGLILACGATLSTSLSSFGKWNVRLLRSDDGGAHWRSLEAPFLKGNDDCGMTAISGGPTTFFAYGRRLLNSSPATVWVTHDAGATWTQAFTPQDEYGESRALSELSASVLRDGVLYGLHSDSYSSNPAFSSSADDGATWTQLLPGSAAEPQQTILSVAPDYALPHAWYQLINPETGPLALEHSSDDGKTWTLLAQFPHAGAIPTQLTTSITQPDQLCAYDFEYDSAASGSLIAGDTTIFSSTDGGVTWRQAPLPVRDGEAQGPVRVGPDGCYLAFEEQPKGGAFGYTYNISAWRLSAGSGSAAQVFLVKDYHLSYATETPGFFYLPAANGMEARFIISATREPHSFLDFFGGNTSSLTTPQLLWTPAM